MNEGLIQIILTHKKKRKNDLKAWLLKIKKKDKFKNRFTKKKKKCDRKNRSETNPLLNANWQKTSSPKGNDDHLRATIQREKKWKDQFFRCLRAANSVVRGRIWPNFTLIQALMYVIITCKYEKDPIKNNQEKVATLFFKL